MDIAVAVSRQTVIEGIKSALADFFHTEASSVDLLARRSLVERLSEIAAAVRAELIDVHPLASIARGALEDLADHVAAIDTLGKSRAVLFHVRHVEEVCAVLEYLLSHPSRYNEFSWRWNNYKVVHGIRNRLLNLKTPLDPMMVQWINANLANLKVVNKKFTGDPSKDLLAWGKYANWLAPVTLADVFAGTNRKASYESQLYAWNSHDVHFSPVGGALLDRELHHQTAYEFIVETCERELDSLCRILLPMVTRTDVLRDLHARLALLDIYRMVTERPAHYAQLIDRSDRFRQLTVECVQPDRVKDRVMHVLLGAAGKDPLVIETPEGDAA